MINAYSIANVALENEHWLADRHRIVYVGTMDQSPQTITNFMLGEVIRFVNDANPSAADCLRSSVAQIDFYDAVVELNLDPNQPTNLLAVYEEDGAI